MDNSDSQDTLANGPESNNKLSILQWSCRTIANKVDHLINYLQNPKQDILMLQSLNAKSHSLPRLDSYYPPETGLENGRVMVPRTSAHG